MICVQGFQFTTENGFKLTTKLPNAHIEGTAFGDWTLSKYEIGSHNYETSSINNINFNGVIEGIFAYRLGTRPITIELECSNGTRKERETNILNYVNKLSYGKIKITETTGLLPLRSVDGFCTVKKIYNDLYHAKIEIDVVADSRFNPMIFPEFEKVLALDNLINMHEWKQTNSDSSIVFGDTSFTLPENKSVILPQINAIDYIFTLKFKANENFRLTIEAIDQTMSVEVCKDYARITVFGYASDLPFSFIDGVYRVEFFVVDIGSDFIITCGPSADGGSCEMSDFLLIPQNKAIYENTVSDAFRLLSFNDELPTPILPGFIFNGWNTAIDGSGTTYSRIIDVPESVRFLYSQWIQRRSVD